MKAINGQNTIYSNDVERALRFYKSFGLQETFRYEPDGLLRHVELRTDGFILGIASVAAAVEDHGLDPQPGGGGIEIVLWVDDTDACHRHALAAGAREITPPKPFQSHLRISWVYDLDGNPLQFAQNTKDFPRG